jgi:hypothetical protein
MYRMTLQEIGRVHETDANNTFGAKFTFQAKA